MSANQKGVQKSLLIPPVLGWGWSNMQIVPVWISKDCLGSRCRWTFQAVARLLLVWPLFAVPVLESTETPWNCPQSTHRSGPCVTGEIMCYFSIQFLFFKQNLKISCVQLSPGPLRTFRHMRTRFRHQQWHCHAVRWYFPTDPVISTKCCSCMPERLLLCTNLTSVKHKRWNCL